MSLFLNVRTLATRSFDLFHDFIIRYYSKTLVQKGQTKAHELFLKVIPLRETLLPRKSFNNIPCVFFFQFTDFPVLRC